MNQLEFALLAALEEKGRKTINYNMQK